MAFLDETGLAYFWQQILAKMNEIKGDSAPKVVVQPTQPTGQVTGDFWYKIKS